VAILFIIGDYFVRGCAIIIVGFSFSLLLPRQSLKENDTAAEATNTAK